MSSSVIDYLATETRLGAHNYEPIGVVLSRGEGVWVWDTDGNRYLDCLSAYSAVSQGHCHPKILAATGQGRAEIETATARALARLSGFRSTVLDGTGLTEGNVTVLFDRE